MARTPRRIDNVDIRYEIDVEPVREALERVRGRFAEAIQQELYRAISTGEPRDAPAPLYHADPASAVARSEWNIGWDLGQQRDRIAQAFSVPSESSRDERRERRRRDSGRPAFFRMVRDAALGRGVARADLVRWSEGRDRIAILFEMLDVVREAVEDGDRLRDILRREYAIASATRHAPAAPHPVAPASVPKSGRGIKLPDQE